MTRRSFRASGALIVRRPQPSRAHGVVVLGKGMAGLATARRLAGVGLDVVALEARDRVGGRMHTLEVLAAEGLPV